MMPFCMIMMIVIILNGFFFLCMKIYSSECCFSFILLCCYELYNNGSVWSFIYFSVVIADKYIIFQRENHIKKFISFFFKKIKALENFNNSKKNIIRKRK